VAGPDRIEHVIEDVRQMKRAHNVHESPVVSSRNGTPLVNGPTLPNKISNSNTTASYGQRNPHDHLQNGETRSGPAAHSMSNANTAASRSSTLSGSIQQQHHDRYRIFISSINESAYLIYWSMRYIDPVIQLSVP
jgi:hypothetical protein